MNKCSSGDCSDKQTISVIENPDCWIIMAVDLYLEQFRIGGGLELMLGQAARQGFFSIRISGKFQLITEDKQYLLDAEKPKEIAPVFDLFTKEISSVVIKEIGDLEINFSNNNKIVVNPDPQYEAWEVHAADYIFIATPGGCEICVFRPKAS